MRWQSIKHELFEQLRLATPIVIFIALFEVILVTNTMAAGRINAQTLSIIGVGQSIWMLIFLTCQGVCTALNPLVAAAHENDDHDQLTAYLGGGTLFSFGVGMVGLMAGHAIAALLPFIGIDETIVDAVADLTRIMSYALPAMCVALGIRYFLEGVSNPRGLVYVQIIVAIFHVLALFFYILPRAQAQPNPDAYADIAWLSVASVHLLALLAVAWVWLNQRFRDWHPTVHSLRSGLGQSGAYLRVGVPIALLVFAETALFSVTNVIAATISSDAAAGHVVTMAHLWIVFMIPLGIANATTVRVARARAAGQESEVRLRGNIGIIIGTIVLLISGFLMFTIPEHIAAIYTTDEATIALAATLMGVAALFQLFDAVQVTTVGALRGLKDTLVPSMIAIFSYWGIAFPAMYYLTITRDGGLKALWFGLLIGLGVAAILLQIRWWRITARR